MVVLWVKSRTRSLNTSLTRQIIVSALRGRSRHSLIFLLFVSALYFSVSVRSLAPLRSALSPLLPRCGGLFLSTTLPPPGARGPLSTLWLLLRGLGWLSRCRSSPPSPRPLLAHTSASPEAVCAPPRVGGWFLPLDSTIGCRHFVLVPLCISIINKCQSTVTLRSKKHNPSRTSPPLRRKF